MLIVCGGIHINTGQTGHLITLSLHLIHGTGTDGGDLTDGTGVIVAGTQIPGTITGMGMAGIIGTAMILGDGVMFGETITPMYELTVGEVVRM